MELTAAIGADWVDVLEGISQDFIQRACVRYQRENPRKKPTPGAIYQLARSLYPPLKATPIDKFSKPRSRAEIVTAEQAKEILGNYLTSFGPKRFGGNGK